MSRTLLGRAAELAQLYAHVGHRQHALLVGPAGVGKSALLHAAFDDASAVLRVAHLAPFKEALLEIAQQLHARDHLQLSDKPVEYLTWEELKPHLSKRTTPELAQLVSPLLADQTLVVDDFDGITAATARIIEPFFAATLIIGAITTLDETPELAPFFWHFQRIILRPLSTADARTLLWQHMDRATVHDPHTFEQHVLQTACGNPLAIRELADQAKRLPINTSAQIHQLHHDAGIRYIDLTPGLLIIGACAVVMRFLALGLNDIETYILAGSVGAFFLVGRYFIYREMRRAR